MEENIQHKSWFGRNWKWVVPTGGCLVLIVLVVVFIGSIYVGVTGLMSDSPAYVEAMEKASTNKELIEKIGEPIEQNGIMGGSVKYSNGRNSAEITIPIKGDKGEASIQVEGSGTDNNWTYEKMEVYISDTNETINLLTTQKLQDTIQ
jgi:hypothetical protein